MSAAAEAPKVVDGLSAEAYHADRTSISSSGLRALLPPGCPAQFHYDREHPTAPKKEFDLGHAAHKLVLGEGEEIVVTEWDDWRTKVAREERDEIRATGAIPLLAHEGEQVQAMAEAIRRHPIAGPLFASEGAAERSIYWTHPDTGVRLRVRPDWLVVRPDITLIVDLKTAADASPDGFSKSIESYSYHQQGALYIDGVQAVGLAPEGARFLFVAQSKKPPYLVTVGELRDQDQEIGRARNERALRIYVDCLDSGQWPDWTGPVTEIPQIGMPTWAVIRQTEEYMQ